MSINGAPVMAATVVAADVGKNNAAFVGDSADRHGLFGPASFAMTAPAPAAVLQRVRAVLLAAPGEGWGGGSRALSPTAAWIWVLPAGWKVLELSPARLGEQRRVQGRRQVKTDAIDLEAITELVLAGHGVP